MNVFVNIFLSFAIKGGSLIIALFTTPAYMSYFANDAVLGVWFTLLSILSWVLNFDLGIGNGLRNKLVKTLGENNTIESKKYISSAYFFLGGLAIGIYAIGAIASKFVNWNSLLGVSELHISSEVLINTVLIVFAGIILQFVLRIITSITYAMQHSYVAGLLNLCTNVLLLCYVTYSNYLKTNGDIISLAFIYLLSVNVPLLVVTILFFAKQLKTMCPSLKFFSMSHAMDTLKLGGTFLYLQLIAMLLNNTANFLVSNLLGADQVVEYQLYNKLFHFICTIAAIGIVPMWSAITKALVEKKYQWLQKAIMLMFALVIVVTVIEFCVVPASPFLFKIWLGDNVREVKYSTAIIFAINGSMFTWLQICSYISNGLGKLKIQAITLSVGVVLSFTVSIIGVRLWSSYEAVTIGMTLGYLPFCITQTLWTVMFCQKLRNGEMQE